MTQRVDLLDYDSYLESSFNPIEFANGLLLATNDPDGNQLDLATPSKRLNFDLKDVDQKIKKLASTNYKELIDQMKKLDTALDTVNVIKPSLDQVNNSYSRIDSDVVKPFEEAMSYHSALKRIHATSTLLRSATYFIYLIQQVEDSFDVTNMSTSPYKSLLVCSRAQFALRQHLNDSQFLKTLKIVRDYDIVLQNRYQQTLEICQNSIRKLTWKSDEQSIGNVILSLTIVSPESLYNVIQQILSNQASTSISILIRTLTSPSSFENVMEDISRKSLLISKLSYVMNKLKWPLPQTKAGNTISESTSSSTEESVTILEKVTKVLELQNMTTTFWRDIALGFEPKFKETINRGGPVGKNLRNYSDTIRQSIKKSVVHSVYQSELKEDSIELIMMLNSVSSLDSKR